MDPVSIFNALYDSKCLKFGDYQLKSGLRVPYYMNLRRLPLYPRLKDAIVTQVVNECLNPHAIASTLAKIRQSRDKSMVDTISDVNGKLKPFSDSLSKELTFDLTDSDSQLTLSEDDSETSSDDSDWENIAMEQQNSNPILCGVPYGAIPLASFIADRLKLPLLFDRKEEKSYGDHQSLLDDFNEETINIAAGIENRNLYPQPMNRKHQVILIEDVICSGESILEAVRRLEKQNIIVEFVICIIDREENGVNLLKQAGIHVIPLYKISTVMRVLEVTGRITSGQFIEVCDWISRNQFKQIGVDPTSESDLAENSSGNGLENTLFR